VKDLLVVIAVVLAAYIAGSLAVRASKASRAAEARRLARIEQRITELESELARSAANSGREGAGIDLEPPTLDKRYAAFHYEALASQAAYERKLAALEWRVTSMGLEQHASRTARCDNRRGATAGDRQHG